MNFYIYDLEGVRTTTLSGDMVGGHTAIIEAKVEEKLNTYDQLILSYTANTSDYDLIREGYSIAFEDIKGWKEYVIGQVVDEDVEGVYRELTANISSIELEDDVLLEEISGSYSISTLLTLLLKDTRFELGYVEDNITKPFDIMTQYRTVSEVLEDVGDLYGVEFRSSYGEDGTKISRRSIDVYTQYGEDSGKVFELDKDVQDIKRTVETEGIKTSILPLGKEPSEETDDEGNKYLPDRLTIEDIEWVEDVNPSVKPKGHLHLTDYQALAEFGLGSIGSKRPKIVVEEFDVETEEELIEEGWSRLQELVVPNITYEATVLDLFTLSGKSEDFEHEKVGIGDIVTIRDFNFYVPMLTRNRIVEMERDLLVPVNNKITLGEGLQKFRSSEKLQEVEELIKNNSDRITTVQTSANGKNKVFRGLNDPRDEYEGVSNGDLWFKPVGDGETELYVFVDGEWETVIDPHINEEIKNRIENAKELAEEARSTAVKASDKVQKAIDDAKDAYEYADSAIKEAGGKNTVYRGSSVPDDGIKNDILFLEKVYNGELINKMYIHDGNSWILRSHDASGLGGTLDLSQLNVINLNMDSATGGSLHLDRGLKVENNGKEVLVAENGNVTMDVDNLLIKSSNVMELMESSFYQEAEAIGMLYKEGGQTKALIGIEEGKPFIKGEHIILDGDTIVDGSFTVTDELFANEMSISKFTTGTLNAKDVRVINMDAGNITTGKLDGIEAILDKGYIGGWKISSSRLESSTGGTGMNSSVTHATNPAFWAGGAKNPWDTDNWTREIPFFIRNNGEIRSNHSDGSYTRLDSRGLVLYDSGTNYQYHHMLHVSTFTVSSSSGRWIQLPSRFRGKEFSVYYAIADSITNPEGVDGSAIHRFVVTNTTGEKLDYARARVPVTGYKRTVRLSNNNLSTSSVQGMIIAIY